MKWLLHILKNKAFLITLGLVLAAALVVAVGAWLGWSWTVRLVGIIGVLLVGLLIMMFNLLRANRGADEIERSIKRQAEQQLLSTRPDRQAEIRELQQQLEQAIERLKQSKLGRGKRGRAALYALPWYMFIGPPGAGKTTAIVNSGMNFPLGTDRIRGVGGTRNCDWFFTDQAILLDTAGRYMTEQDDTEEWFAFLDTLKTHRTERPINGVLVGIGIDELLQARPDEIEWHADNIRRRVDELIGRLGVRFPVYLVFTKCDLLQGFVEFFGELSRQEREQIWGCTLTDEQQASRDLQAVFEHEFDLLAGVLINRRTARLSRPMKREERQKVYAFPLQFASMRENLAHFVGRLFQPNPYQESPIFRGFYFTSGTQEGVPLDRVIQNIARQFDLTPAAETEGFYSEPETKSYFLHDVFTEVVVPDQFMARRTTKATRKGTIRRLGVTAAAAVLLLLFVLGASQALVRSKISLDQARDVAHAAAVLRWDDRAALPDNLNRLDRLRREVDRLGRTQLLSLGLSRNGTVREPLQRLYLDQLRTFLQQYAVNPLENRIRTASRATGMEATRREALYADLKAYLLLTREARRLGDRDEGDGYRNFLVRTLSDLALSAPEVQQIAVTSGGVREQVEPQIRAFVSALREDTLRAFAADERLIEQARARIYEPPSIRGVYERLRLEGRDNLPAFTLRDAVPGRYLDLFSGTPEVSGFFTKQGWETYVADRIEAESQDPARDDWVMGRDQSQLPEEMQNRDRMARQLAELYFNDYATEWERFLRGVRIRPFSNLRQAAGALDDLSDPFESPLSYLLARVTEQTTFEGGTLEQLQQQAGENLGRRIDRQVRRFLGSETGVGQDGQPELHPVDRRFRWLHGLDVMRAQSNEAAPEFYRVFEHLTTVSARLSDVAGDPARAAALAAGVLSQGGGELGRAVDEIRRALRAFDADVRTQLFIQPVLYAWGTVLASAQQHLNDRWREQVYDPFQRAFAGQFPFDRTSTVDAPLLDVERFFDPAGGPVAVFVEQELKPFTGRDLERPQTWEGQGLRLSPATLQAIRRAQRIGENLYSGGSMRVAFEMQPDVPERSGNAPIPEQVSIRLLGKEDTYRLGSPFWTAYQWPGEPGVIVRLSTRAGELPPKRYEGEWALFRLLHEAQVRRKPGSSTEYEVRIPFEEPGQYVITARYHLRTRSSANPFDNPSGFFDFRPPERLN